MANLEDIVKQIEGLTVLEVSELVKALEEKFGVSAAVPMAVAAAPAAGGDAAPAEEKDSYTIIMAGAGEQKINVIKAIREIKPDLGLKEAKDLTEALPATIAENVKPAEAEEMKKKLEEAGATVELK
ncbi:50S ribosomal protein L7/L12 [candidate division WWE3 bacterium]|uniref:Large ribosomal subunit protein bL12 n=1 Tax=candidate division WWE3 bacterium TaxID=2053526 RepID=A0A955LKN7_UNCKA|nr:50S ribosomal protein L7/L12 [candidate division WWE3 bacterium]